jgi:hypothetical protein
VDRPDIRKRLKSVIHMDMVGGGPVTKAQFHITRGPASLPCFIHDIADHAGEFVNELSQIFADTGSALYPLNSPEGGKEPLQAIFAPFSMGSDHQIYTEGSYRIPAIYFNDWPDRYIHTNFDVPANIDPTKLKRAAFLGAVTAAYLANFKETDVNTVWPVLKAAALNRTATILKRIGSLSDDEKSVLRRFHMWHEQEVFESMNEYVDVTDAFKQEWSVFERQIAELIGDTGAKPAYKGTVYERNISLPGPMSVFGFDYLEDKFGAAKAKNLKLLKLPAGGIYAYEALNFVNGTRTVQEIRDLLSGAYGPVQLDAVAEYLDALASIHVIHRKER